MLFQEHRNNLPLQSRPSPTYPGLQVQFNDPLVLLHNASALQLCVPATHSSMSEKNVTFLSYKVIDSLSEKTKIYVKIIQKLSMKLVQEN